jgi:hypothetical protein
MGIVHRADKTRIFVVNILTTSVDGRTKQAYKPCANQPKSGTRLEESFPRAEGFVLAGSLTSYVKD